MSDVKRLFRNPQRQATSRAEMTVSARPSTVGVVLTFFVLTDGIAIITPTAIADRSRHKNGELAAGCDLQLTERDECNSLYYIPAHLRNGASNATIVTGTIALLCRVVGLIRVVKLLDGRRNDEAEHSSEEDTATSLDTVRMLIISSIDS